MDRAPRLTRERLAVLAGLLMLAGYAAFLHHHTALAPFELSDARARFPGRWEEVDKVGAFSLWRIDQNLEMPPR